MNDTSPEMEKWVREELMKRSGAERFRMGCELFDISRRIMIASFPPGLSELEKLRMIWERTYGEPADWIKE